MNDVMRAGRVPALTAATAAMLTAGLLTATSTSAATSSSLLALLGWAVALVGAVVQFLTLDRPTSRRGLLASLVSLLASAAVWGALGSDAAGALAGVSTLLFLVLATGTTVARASQPRVTAG